MIKEFTKEQKAILKKAEPFDRSHFIFILREYQEETRRARSLAQKFGIARLFTFDKRIQYVDELLALLADDNFSVITVLKKMKSGLDDFCGVANGDLYQHLMKGSMGLFLFLAPGSKREMAVFSCERRALVL